MFEAYLTEALMESLVHNQFVCYADVLA